MVALRQGAGAQGRAALDAARHKMPELAHYDILRARLVSQGRDEVDLDERQLFMFEALRNVQNFIVSYPKCGRTWLRVLLGKFIIGFESDADPLELLDLTRDRAGYSGTEFTHDDYPHWRPHWALTADKRLYRGRRVLFLARDPRDALVSNYFQYVKRGDASHAGDAFDGDLSAFIRHRTGGLPSIVEFYNIWAESLNVPAAFEIARYEDLVADPQRTLGRIVAFLGWPEQSAEYLERVVEYGSFDNMRKLEQNDAFGNSRLAPPKDGDADGFKTRKGKVGGYTDYLTPEDIAYIDTILAERLDPVYGY